MQLNEMVRYITLYVDLNVTLMDVDEDSPLSSSWQDIIWSLKTVTVPHCKCLLSSFLT